MVNRQCQKIAICNLTRTQHRVPAHPPGIEDTDVIGPEFMPLGVDGLAQSSGDAARWHRIRVGWLRHDADDAVLRERARGPTLADIRAQPTGGQRMVNMLRVEQRDQDIDIQQRAQVKYYPDRAIAPRNRQSRFHHEMEMAENRKTPGIHRPGLAWFQRQSALAATVPKPLAPRSFHAAAPIPSPRPALRRQCPELCARVLSRTMPMLMIMHHCIRCKPET